MGVKGTAAKGPNIGPYTIAYEGVSLAESAVVGSNCVLGSRSRSSDAIPTIIAEGAWIGDLVVIDAGVTIGRGAVVHSGAVVTAAVPANAIVEGNPVLRI